MTFLIRCLAMHQVHRNFAKRFDHSRLLQELRRTSDGDPGRNLTLPRLAQA